MARAAWITILPGCTRHLQRVEDCAVPADQHQQVALPQVQRRCELPGVAPPHSLHHRNVQPRGRQDWRDLALEYPLRPAHRRYVSCADDGSMQALTT